MVKVKICGISNYEDAAMAVHLRVDAIGFIFAPSPRQITPEKAREIIRAIPPHLKTVGVFVNERPDTVRRIRGFCGLDLIQFHGDESPEVCGDFMPHTIKAFRIRDRSVLQTIKPYCGKIRAMLFDTYVRETMGGTGKTFDWRVARKTKELGFLLVLSGGLTPDNVKQAIREVNPYAVDVAGGVEAGPGKKSPEKLSRFIQEVKELK